ncbi:unnamed protein product [Prorocentrum cordatum]|uniref:Transmembrane protein n=1 Tax=Prorocentrum cordatum TaxID=2364126 RepID=A0ABN9R8U8_9DINO|nr:unnamed protein product [Polarella glacialis]
MPSPSSALQRFDAIGRPVSMLLSVAVIVVAYRALHMTPATYSTWDDRWCHFGIASEPDSQFQGSFAASLDATFEAEWDLIEGSEVDCFPSLNETKVLAGRRDVVLSLRASEYIDSGFVWFFAIITWVLLKLFLPLVLYIREKDTCCNAWCSELKSRDPASRGFWDAVGIYKNLWTTFLPGMILAPLSSVKVHSVDLEEDSLRIATLCAESEWFASCVFMHLFWIILFMLLGQFCATPCGLCVLGVTKAGECCTGLDRAYLESIVGLGIFAGITGLHYPIMWMILMSNCGVKLLLAFDISLIFDVDVRNSLSA